MARGIQAAGLEGDRRGRPSGDGDREGGEEIDDEERGTGEPSLEASIGRGRPSCWELLAAVPLGDKPLPATELP